MTTIAEEEARLAADAPWLVLEHVSKAYGAVQALMDFSMSIGRGEVVGIIGENGAGKSTLMKILGGVVSADSGRIVIDGAEQHAFGVAESMKAGIAFVHQELNLFDNLDVAGNVFIGREKHRGGALPLLDRQAQQAAVAPLLARLGASFKPDTPVSSLSIAQCQMVEIAKALSMEARLVILDEPTSSLPLAETDKLLGVIGELKRAGISVIFITHRLHEIERAADRVVALRDGRLAGTLARAEIDHDRMVKLMIGRDLKLAEGRAAGAPGPVVLAARGIRTPAYPAKAVDLDLRAGEILGLAGLVGAGRTELARVLFGIDRAGAGGQITLGGERLVLRNTADAVRQGIFLVPEDRKLCGVLLDLPIAENITLPNLGAHARRWLVSRRMEDETAEAQRRALAIKVDKVSTPARSLSGGNQQKVVLAKWLAMKPRVMIFDEPTRGIDIGAKAEIYRLMRGLADAGVAILMISSDMEEVIGASDRIAVMHEGGIAGYLDRAEFSEENVLLLAVGKGRNGNQAA
ncbi:sugar ABC transporter ATP-binding protein [Acidisoma sp. C75]